MNLEFLSARNGQQTCSADGRFLHSSFNPQVEAQRFVDAMQCSFEPAAIVLMGTCLSWCVEPLKNRFPNTELIAVHYDSRFAEYSNGWNYSFTVTDEAESASFSNSLFNILGEEKLMITQFVSWKPSESVWPDQNTLSWRAVKSSMDMAQSVLTTRNHFNLRWFKNTVRNLSRIKRYAIPEKTSKPILVTASGPNLNKVLPFIRDNRTSFMLIAASSSISTLLANDIIPDFCISTDGGYYAKKHLRAYDTDSRLKNVPLIISGESAVPSSLTDKIPFTLLSYGDGIETILAEHLSLPSIRGLRNGTVSGTAAALALSLTTGNVYMCGLDLAPGKGFQHAEPNENDVPLFTGQSRIKTLESAQAGSRYASGSLGIYRQWFSNQNEAFNSRVFRLASESETLETLGSLKDISPETIKLPKSTDTSRKNAPSFYKIQDAPAACGQKMTDYLLSVCDLLQENPDNTRNDIWYSSIAIKTFISYLRMNPETKAEELSKLLNETTAVIKEVICHV